jgi:hypothetical protein
LWENTQDEAAFFVKESDRANRTEDYIRHSGESHGVSRQRFETNFSGVITSGKYGSSKAGRRYRGIARAE